MSEPKGERKKRRDFNKNMFTPYDLARLLGVKYHKALKIVKTLMDYELAQKVEHDGDKRKRRYRIV